MKRHIATASLLWAAGTGALSAQEATDTAAQRFLLSLDLSSGLEALLQAGQTLDAVIHEFGRFGQAFSRFFTEMANYGFAPGRAFVLATLCLVVACLVEWMLRRVLNRVIDSAPNADTGATAGWLALRFGAEASALITFGLLTFLPLLLLLREDPVATACLIAILPAILIVRAVEAALRVLLLSGQSQGALSQAEAQRLYLSVTVMAALSTLAVVSTSLFEQGGLAQITVLAYTFLTRGAVTICLVLIVFLNGGAVTRLLACRRDGTARPLRWQKFGAVWHILTASYIAVSFLGTSLLLLTGTQEANSAAFKSFVVLVLAVVSALWLESAVKAPEGAPAQRSILQEIFARTGVPSVFGITVIVLLALWSPIWNHLPMLDVATSTRTALIQIAMTVFLTFLMWQLVNVMAQRHTVHKGIDGTPGTRFGTLVPLLKIMLLLGLVFVSIISIMSSLGVDVLPLFAGASIIGLAVGLGSQTLVKDVVSGLFFLIDDAFRIGEYVDLGVAKGTVESVSIRSMRLRHHLGTVHTIPYGEIKTISNMSRDWVVLRVEFRVPFDVDPNRFRKSIKTLGAELRDDPELGPLFIEPLKSQGVIGIEEGAMIVRCKFTTAPGDQWVVRRRVYEELRKLFAREGITVAVRQVHVSSKDAEARAGQDPKMPEQSGAAEAIIEENLGGST